jgi:hypothetical protein
MATTGGPRASKVGTDGTSWMTRGPSQRSASTNRMGPDRRITNYVIFPLSCAHFVSFVSTSLSPDPSTDHVSQLHGGMGAL